jgi:hypothetical protein
MRDGMETGKTDELKETIKILMLKKLSINQLPEEIKIKIKASSIAELESIRDNIFEINSLEELDNYLK